MGKTSRILLFIFLNIIISSAVTLTVLWLWERAHPRLEYVPITQTERTATITQDDEQRPEQPPENFPAIVITNEDILIQIRTIVGAGDLSVEYVEIINQGQNPADLTGWQLIDEGDHQFLFPALILNSGGAIKVLSRAGTNTVIELFWQSDAPIWQPGEMARLLNATGELVATYTIP